MGFKIIQYADVHTGNWSVLKDSTGAVTTDRTEWKLYSDVSNGVVKLLSADNDATDENKRFYYEISFDIKVTIAHTVYGAGCGDVFNCTNGNSLDITDNSDGMTLFTTTNTGAINIDGSKSTGDVTIYSGRLTTAVYSKYNTFPVTLNIRFSNPLYHGITLSSRKEFKWGFVADPSDTTDSGNTYIYTENGWKKGIPYIYTSSGWKRATNDELYIYNGTNWKK